MNVGSINYTGMRTLNRNRVNIELYKTNGKLSFSVSMNLDGLNLNRHSKVSITAHYAGIRERFELGTVGKLVIPPRMDITIIEDSDLMNFDIFVSESDGKKQAQIESLRIQTKKANVYKETILPVNIVPLGKRPYNVRIDSSGAILELNSEIPDIKDKIENNHLFRWTVFSAALGQILNTIVHLGEIDEDEGGWKSDWVNFTKNVLGIYDMPKLGCDEGAINEDQEDWIERCIDKMSEKHNFLDTIIYNETT